MIVCCKKCFLYAKRGKVNWCRKMQMVLAENDMIGKCLFFCKKQKKNVKLKNGKMTV